MGKIGWGQRWALKNSTETNVADGARRMGHRWQDSAYPVGKLQDGSGGGTSRVRSTWEQRLYFCPQKGVLPLFWRVNCLPLPPPAPHLLTFLSPGFMRTPGQIDFVSLSVPMTTSNCLPQVITKWWPLFCLWIIPTKIFLALLLPFEFKFTGLQL